MQRIPATSLDYLRVPITETTNDIDPTDLDVDIALIPYEYVVGQTVYEEPAEEDWQPAEWAPDGPPYVARVLLPPGTPADYQVWVRITGDPEVPVRRAGRVQKGTFVAEEATGSGT